MKIVANITRGSLVLGSSSFKISCMVRTLRNKTRKRDEVITSIPDRLPYDPCSFPKGIYHITGVEWQKINDNGKPNFDVAVYGPVKIRTDASQLVNVWTLDEDGDYLQETEQQVRDSGYLLHYSESKTTLGCIRIGSPEEARILGKIIEDMLKKEKIDLEVLYV